MNEVIESLKFVRQRIVEAIDEENAQMDNFSSGLSQGVIKGLNKALVILDEEIESEKIWQEVDAMTPEDINAYLISQGIDTERLSAELAVYKTLFSKIKGSSL